MDGEIGGNWISEGGHRITEYLGLVMGGGRRYTSKQRLDALFGRVDLQEASRRLSVKAKTKPPPKELKGKRKRKPPQPLPITIHGAQGIEFLRKRATYVRARVFLELLKRQGLAVSLWEVMKKARAKKPWATAGDVPLITEAARDVGMNQFKKEKALFFK